MIKKFCIFFLLVCIVSSPYAADDLDDGMGGDDPIDDNLQLNKNVDYIKRSAVAKARRYEASGKKSANSGCGGAGNQSFGPGTDLKGATIINLSNNKGASSVCVTK